MESQKKAYENGWKAQIKPQRVDYFQSDLGLPIQIINDEHIYREDFQVKNQNGEIIVGSFYYPQKYQKRARNLNDSSYQFDRLKSSLPGGNSNNEENICKVDCSDLPVLIYLHSHSGSRIEGRDLLNHFCPKFGVCLFDLSGCGMSEGNYVTLGIKEQLDLIAIIKWLNERKVYDIALWGRSMGAATAQQFTYSSANYIRCQVQDSPYGKVTDMVKDTEYHIIKSTT